ncbi:MAG: diacylglycerol kinase, partial [Pseudonocardiales bacterium]|nr:diacylglycerol kinase [Pseudonocardiales bacterium]
DPADGLFDVTIGGATSRRKVIRQLPDVYKGRHVERAEVEVLRTSSLRLESPGINAYADGEYLGPLPADVSLIPEALQLLVP